MVPPRTPRSIGSSTFLVYPQPCTAAMGARQRISGCEQEAVRLFRLAQPPSSSGSGCPKTHMYSPCKMYHLLLPSHLALAANARAEHAVAASPQSTTGDWTPCAPLCKLARRPSRRRRGTARKSRAKSTHSFDACVSVRRVRVGQEGESHDEEEDWAAAHRGIGRGGHRRVFS